MLVKSQNSCYIGSTTEKLSQRVARDRRDYKSYLYTQCKPPKTPD